MLTGQVELEIRNYENMKNRAGKNEKIEVWWKKHAPMFPILGRFVQDICSITVSSATSERVFSTGTKVVTPQRCQLSAQTIENLILFKQNFKKVRAFKEKYKLEPLPRVQGDQVHDEAEQVEVALDDLEDEFHQEDDDEDVQEEEEENLADFVIEGLDDNTMMETV